LGGVESKDVDYSAVLTKIIQTESPDAILYCTNFNTSAGLMVKQIRQGSGRMRAIPPSKLPEAAMPALMAYLRSIHAVR